MSYTTFNKKKFDASKEPMFFGESVNVARYDIQKYNVFEKLIEKQLSFFWRPEEVDISRDRIDFKEKLNEHERHIFISNLKYQTLLDSIQGRSPNIAFLKSVSLPELETWIETWSFSETIHSRSYTHIIRNVFEDPSIVFDDIVENPEIQKRASAVTEYYDEYIQYFEDYQKYGEGTTVIKNNHGTKEITLSKKELMKKLFLSIVSVNVLEAIRFYVSFACSFAFAERELMEGNAKIIKLIARDEALHLTGTQYMIQKLASGVESEEWRQVVRECKDQMIAIFVDAAEQEKEWADYLFKDGSMIGLNKTILSQYVDYITDLRMQTVGLEPHFNQKENPVPWIDSWLSSDNVQVAPQETEISSYLVGQIDNSVSDDDLDDLEL